MSGSTPSVTETVQVIYTGPATQISELGISGPGADKFTVISPAPGAPLEGKTLVTVRFQTDVLDLFTTYKALLTIKTANLKRPAYVVLTGRRDT